MKNLFRYLIIAAFSLSLTSCASVINGTTQKIPVDTNPEGATVYVDGVMKGKTPTVLTLKRKHSHVITLEKEGYETKKITLKSNMSASVAGNVLAGGLIGWAVDANNGSQKKLTPKVVNENLEKKSDEESSK